MTRSGQYDGVMPIYYDDTLTGQFVFSDPFPGGHIGLLKHKNLEVSYAVDPTQDLVAALRALQEYEFGVVRGRGVYSGIRSGRVPEKTGGDR